MIKYNRVADINSGVQKNLCCLQATQMLLHTHARVDIPPGGLFGMLVSFRFVMLTPVLKQKTPLFGGAAICFDYKTISIQSTPRKGYSPLD
jgi:hypothetical protein